MTPHDDQQIQGDAQLGLLLRKDWQPLTRALQIELAKQVRTVAEAWQAMETHSPFDNANEIYLRTGIDGATWSRIRSGQANPSLDKLPEVMRVCQNQIVFYHIQHICGIDPETGQPYRSELERENEELKQTLKTVLGWEAAKVGNGDMAANG